ncbi:MAG: hypothetical protein KDD40_03375 [Bdellovibrionales bacterium]|nr:hypothetical protein [Bdellovibrionales bacterium]
MIKSISCLFLFLFSISSHSLGASSDCSVQLNGSSSAIQSKDSVLNVLQQNILIQLSERSLENERAMPKPMSEGPYGLPLNYIQQVELVNGNIVLSKPELYIVRFQITGQDIINMEGIIKAITNKFRDVDPEFEKWLLGGKRNIGIGLFYYRLTKDFPLDIGIHQDDTFRTAITPIERDSGIIGDDLKIYDLNENYIDKFPSRLLYTSFLKDAEIKHGLDYSVEPDIEGICYRTVLRITYTE